MRASRGKLPRAQPVAALYSQGRVRHGGLYSDLEDQLTSWVPGAQSPDRLDALVWGLTALVIYGSNDIETWGGSDTKKESSEHVREVARHDGVWFPPSQSRW